MDGLYYLPGVIVALSLLCCGFSASDKAGFFGLLPRSAEPPAPVDCQISNWGDWSECDPCTSQQYRSRSIVKFGQYGGTRCLSSLGDYQSCKPDKNCEHTIIDCRYNFKCKTGRCIDKRLLCNGDNDCGDNSDETCDGNKNPKPPCHNIAVKLSELGKKAGEGFNILGVETKRNPYDNEYFNGMCERVPDGNTRTYFRKPYNLGSLNYQRSSVTHFTTETYEDSVELLAKVIQEQTTESDISLTVKVTPTERNDTTITGNVGLKASRNESLQIIKEYSKKTNKLFLRVLAFVQLATFDMRSRDNIMSPTFIEDLNNLPASYQKAEYFALLEMYGTHYAVYGVIGGKYELVYVLDSIAMKTKGVTTKDIAHCLGYGVGLSMSSKGIDLFFNVKVTDCENILSNVQGDTESSPVIENVVSFVEGGTIDFTTLLEEKLSRRSTEMDVPHFVKWVSTLVDAPVILKRRLSPIYNLVPDDLRDSNIKKKNLKRAIEDYMDEYNVCKCRPCQNGGTLILLDGECLCKCPLEYKGIACEKLKQEPLSKPSKPLDGKWSCWQPSTSCINEEETRTRTCSNPPRQYGGRTCEGSNTRTVPC